MVELVISTKGKLKLSYNGFFYARQQEKSGKVRYSGAILTDTMSGNPNPTTAHNHVRDQGRIDAMKKHEEMKHLAISTVAGPSAMIDVLAFLPVNDVALGMAFLQQNVHPHPQAMELLNYFDSTYVNGFQRNLQLPGHPAVVQMVPPMFPPVLWNVHIPTLNNDPRTNNVCESWNNAYYHIVGHHHPSIWNSVQGLQK